MPEEKREQDKDLVFALDIGTRSIIGVVGRADGERLQVLAIENLAADDPIGPRGAGEISVNFALPAVANALAIALQRPVTHIPMTPERVIAALESHPDSAVP